MAAYKPFEPADTRWSNVDFTVIFASFFNCITYGSRFTKVSFTFVLLCLSYCLMLQWKAKEKAYLENKLLKHWTVFGDCSGNNNLSSYAVFSGSSRGWCSRQCNVIILCLGARQYIFFFFIIIMYWWLKRKVWQTAVKITSPLEKVCLIKLWSSNRNSILLFLITTTTKVYIDYLYFLITGKKRNTCDQNKSKLLKTETLPTLKLKPWLLWFQDFVQYYVIVWLFIYKMNFEPLFVQCNMSSYSKWLILEINKNFSQCTSE